VVCDQEVESCDCVDE